MAERARKFVAWTVALAVACSGIWFAWTFLGFVVAGHYEGIAEDHWYFMGRLRLMEERGHSVWGTFTAGFNVHRIVVGRLLLYAETTWFQARNVFSVGVGLLFHAGILASCLVALSRARWLDGPTRLLLTGTALAFSCAAIQLTAVVEPWNLTFTGCYGAALISLLCLSRMPGRDRTVALGAGVVAFALVSTYSLAAGLVLWPTVLVVGMVAGVRRRDLLIFALVAVPVIATYLTGGVTRSSQGTAAVTADFIPWLLACLGRALSMVDVSAGRLLGGLGVLGALWVVVRQSRDRERAVELDWFALGLLVFGGGSVAMMALGRAARLPDTWDAGRYQPFVAIFWLGLILSYYSIRARGARSEAGAERPSWRFVMGWLVPSLLLIAYCAAILAPAHLAVGRSRMVDAEYKRGGNVAILMGVGSRREYRFLLPHRVRAKGYDFVKKRRAMLRDRGLAVFSHGHQDLLGVPLADALEVVDQEQCSGEIRSVRRTGGHRRLDGVVAASEAGSEVTALVLAASGADPIRGLGLTVQRRNPAVAIEPRGPELRFRAYAPLGEPGELQLWAVLDGKRACPVGA